MKFLQWQPGCTMRTDGQTDITKLTIAVCTFAKAPKNSDVLFMASLYSLHSTIWCNDKWNAGPIGRSV